MGTDLIGGVLMGICGRNGKGAGLVVFGPRRWVQLAWYGGMGGSMTGVFFPEKPRSG